MSLLEIRNLRTRVLTPAGPAMAVDGVDLSIGAGEAVGLVGESGSGKTLLALSILGLLPDRARGILEGSSIRLRGEELIGAGEARMRKVRGGEVAMVFQEPAASLNPVLTIGEQVREVLAVHAPVNGSSYWEEVVGLLSEVGIADPAERAKAYPHQLSGGMRQRALIAMALAGRPSLLVADEPTTALDVTLQTQVLELLGQLQRERQMALLLVSHDLGVVTSLCQRVVVLYGGRVMEDGPVQQVLEQPMHPYTKGLMKARPSAVAQGVMVPIPGEVPEATRWPRGCRFHPRCPEAMTRCASQEPGLLDLSNVVAPEEDSGFRPREARRVRCWLAHQEGGNP